MTPSRSAFSQAFALALAAAATACGGGGGSHVAATAATILDFSTTGPGGGSGVARQTQSNPFTITGTGLPGVGASVTVRFTTSGGDQGTLRFAGSSSTTVDVAGVVATPATVTGTTPVATGQTTAFTSDVRVVVGGTPSNPVDPIAWGPPPVVTAVASDLQVKEYAAGSFLSACSTRMTITGKNFDPAATLLVYDNGAGTGTPVGSGALGGMTVVGPTTIRGRSPRAPSLASDRQAAVRVTNPDGQSGTFTSASLVFRVKGHLQNTDASQEAGTNAEMESAIDPTDPKNLATLTHSPGASMRFAYSTDAGSTWAQSLLGTSVDGLSGGFRSDPRVAYDRFGNLYAAYFHIPGANAGKTVVVLQSTDKGATWATKRTVVDTAEGIDKEFLVTGPDGSDLTRDAIYVGWDDTAGHFTPGGAAGIVVAMATCTGAGVAMSTFGTPVNFVDAPIGNGQLSNAAVGANGDLYVVWNDYTLDLTGKGPTVVKMDRAPGGLLGGVGFGTDVTVASSNVGGFDAIPAQPNRTIYALPDVAVIRAGPKAGRVVISWTSESPDESNDTDVVAVYTDDSGAHWSGVKRINDDSGTTSQFLPSLRTDPVTGALVAAWYDCRNDALNNRRVQVFAAASYDYGATWSANLRVSDGTSDVATRSDTEEYLDYLGLAVYDGEAFVSFTDNSNSAGGPDGTAAAEDLVTRFQVK